MQSPVTSTRVRRKEPSLRRGRIPDAKGIATGNMLTAACSGDIDRADESRVSLNVSGAIRLAKRAS